MTKYRVYGLMTASVLLGEYEADTQPEAYAMAINDPEANWYPSICHQCAGQTEVIEEL